MLMHCHRNSGSKRTGLFSASHQLQCRLCNSHVRHGTRPDGGTQKGIHSECGLLLGRCPNSTNVSLFQHKGDFDLYFTWNLINCGT